MENQLKKMAFFSRVKQDTVERLWQVGMIHRYRKGFVLLHAQQPLQMICFQLTGKSVIYTLAHSGKRKIHFILGAGALLNQNTTSGCVESSFCEMLENSTVFEIPVSVFETLMEQDFSLVRAILMAQERKLWRLEHQLKNTIGSIYMERKLAAKLWKLSRDFGKETGEGVEIDFNMPITFLADMLGTPRETASRLCNQLAGNGLIQMNRKRVVVKDMDKLAHFYKTGTL